MKILLVVIALLAILFGGSIFTEAQSAIHQIAGLVSFLIAVVALGNVGIISAIQKQEKENISEENETVETKNEDEYDEIKKKILEDGYTFISNNFVRKNDTEKEYRVSKTENKVYILADDKVEAEYNLA